MKTIGKIFAFIGVVAGLIIVGIIFVLVALYMSFTDGENTTPTKTITTKQGDIFDTSYSRVTFPDDCDSVKITDKKTGSEAFFSNDPAVGFEGITFLCYENGNRVYIVKNFNGLLFKDTTTGALSEETVGSLTENYRLPRDPTITKQTEKSFKEHNKMLRILCLNGSADVIYYYAEMFVKEKDTKVIELVRYYSKAPDAVADSYFTAKYCNDLGWKSSYYMNNEEIVERCKEIVKKYNL